MILEDISPDRLLLTTYCVPGTVLGAGEARETEPAPPIGRHRGKQKLLCKVMGLCSRGTEEGTPVKTGTPKITM